MSEYAEGTVLTCGHGDCGCRVRIEAKCDCDSVGAPYVCTCGEPMIEVAPDAKERPATR